MQDQRHTRHHGFRSCRESKRDERSRSSKTHVKGENVKKMAEVANVAGSSLVIKGKLDTQEIERGFDKVKNGFNSVGRDSKSVFGDFNRLAVVSQTLGRLLTAAGVAAGGMLAGAMKKAPALASAMAQIKVAIDRMFRALGEGLEPIFNRIAGWFEGLANWSEAHPDLFAGIVASFVTLAALKWTGILVLLGKLAAPIAAGSVFAGLLALAGLGGLVSGLVAIILALAESFKMNELTPVPIPEAAKTQIATAGTSELIDLQSRYAARITGAGYGGEYTPQIDLETGELYGTKHMMRDIVRNSQSQFNYTTYTFSTRDMAMNQADSFFN